MTLLKPGTPTPPGRLVFVPEDGRRVDPPSFRVRVGMPLKASIQLSLKAGAFRAEWILVQCLVALRGEFNRLSPNRDKTSDGSIGDTAHAASSSDHNPDETGATPYEDSDSINEVHAIDVDSSGPWPAGITFQDILDRIVAEHRAGRDDRLQNIIYNRRIISRSWNWSEWRAYTGANAHTQHGHFSARYTTAQEADTSAWGVASLMEDDLVTSQAEFNTFLTTALKNQTIKDLFASALLDHAYGNDIRTARTVRRWIKDNHQLRDLLAGDEEAATAINLETDAPVKQMAGLPAQVAALATVLGQVLAKVTDDDAETAQILAAIDSLRFDSPEQSAADVAARLRPLLGDRAAEVGRALAG
jgi:hypothetical protein